MNHRSHGHGLAIFFVAAILLFSANIAANYTPWSENETNRSSLHVSCNNLGDGDECLVGDDAKLELLPVNWETSRLLIANAGKPLAIGAVKRRNQAIPCPGGRRYTGGSGRCLPLPGKPKEDCTSVYKRCPGKGGASGSCEEGCRPMVDDAEVDFLPMDWAKSPILAYAGKSITFRTKFRGSQYRAHKGKDISVVVGVFQVPPRGIVKESCVGVYNWGCSGKG